VKLAVRAGETGRLYGSVTPAEIVDAVMAAGGPLLDRRRVQLPGAVKSVGDYKVQIKLHPEVTATFTLTVHPAK
jgi:large subunit ribosomal protein L9